MNSRQPGSPVKFDFFTTTHRITGEVQTGPKPLSDLLNDKSQSYLLVYKVYVSRLSEPATIGAHAPVAYLSKENLGFVIAPWNEVRSAGASHLTTQEYEALITLPGFEVRGRFAGRRRLDVRSFSLTTLDSFVALREATAQMLTTSEVTFSGEAILINRAHLESFCLTE